MTKILDAHALLVFLERELGFEKVKAIFSGEVEKDKRLLMTSVNFGEVFYIVLRDVGEEKALEIEKTIHSLPIEIINVDIQIAKEAVHFKSRGKMSYADCFVAALAKIHKGEIITGDKEFKAVESEVKISWIT